MFDGVFGSDPYRDWQRDEPQQAPPPRAPWPLIAMLIVFAMFSIVAAIAYPAVFAAGLEGF
jgi:hypothetical protein